MRATQKRCCRGRNLLFNAASTIKSVPLSDYFSSKGIDDYTNHRSLECPTPHQRCSAIPQHPQLLVHCRSYDNHFYRIATPHSSPFFPYSKLRKTLSIRRKITCFLATVAPSLRIFRLFRNSAALQRYLLRQLCECISSQNASREAHRDAKFPDWS